MKTEALTTLLLALTVVTSLILPCTSQAGDYKPELFKSVKLIFAEEFEKDGPHQNSKQWEIRQNTQWNVKDGVLTGAIATEEYQKKMQAIGDGHDGTRPALDPARCRGDKRSSLIAGREMPWRCRDPFGPTCPRSTFPPTPTAGLR